MNYKNFYALIFLASCAFAAFHQATSLTANASHNTPLTSPITSPITAPVTPTPTPSAYPVLSPTVTQSPSNNGNKNNNNNNNNGNNNSSNNSGGQNNNATCTDSAPQSSPVVTRALTTGRDQITLFYATPHGRVSSYSLVYGVKSGSYLYGLTGINGSQNVVSINGLTRGKTYFFRVSASNGCATGPASEEISIKVGSSSYSRVLGAKNTSRIFTPSIKNSSANQSVSKNQVQPAPQKQSFFKTLLKFFN